MNRFTLIALLSAVVVVGCASDKDKKAKEAAQTPPAELTAPAQPTPIPATPVNPEPAMTVAPAPVVAPAPTPAPAAKPVTVAKPAVTVAKPAVTTSKIYVVKKGDSLSEIAHAHNTTVKKIMALNPSIKSADRIEAGQKIKLP